MLKVASISKALMLPTVAFDFSLNWDSKNKKNSQAETSRREYRYRIIQLMLDDDNDNVIDIDKFRDR